MPSFLPIAILLGYLCLLWVISMYFEKWRNSGHGFSRKPLIYGLAITVYASAWTFFGAVGEAAAHGYAYLPVLIGPALMAAFWMIWLRKAILISKSQGIGSIADFLAARFGKSIFLGGLVSLLILLAMLPYLALQFKALGIAFAAFTGPVSSMRLRNASPSIERDTVFYIALALAVFAAFWGARRLDSNEPQKGLVAVIAFEALLIWIVFLVFALVMVWGHEGGIGAIFVESGFPVSNQPPSSDWMYLLVASGLSVTLLPHVFHMAVVENTQPNHVRQASYVFPAYLFVFALFALPIGLLGSLKYGMFNIDPDAYLMVLAREIHPIWVGIPVFVGGLAASVGVLVLAVLALSNMVTNNLLVPVFLKTTLFRNPGFSELSRRLIGLRQVTIGLIFLLAYIYYHLLGRHVSLADSGRTALIGVLQFAPMAFAGLYWRQATRKGAVVGLVAGMLLWAYCLVVPQLAELGYFSRNLITDGPFGILWLKPTGLFGMNSLSTFSHAIVWSVAANLALFIGVSQFTTPDRIEQEQAAIFVNTPSYVKDEREAGKWRGKAGMKDLNMLMGRFLGEQKTRTLLEGFAHRNGYNLDSLSTADSDLVMYAERQLAGVIGSASARLLISSIVVEEPVTMKEVIEVLDERQALFQYSQELERKSKEIIQKGKELNEAYQSLLEMDSLKNEFITTVTHELRTPITSIRSLCSILYHNPDLPEEKRKSFLEIVISESERVSRLITQVLDLEKMEAGLAELEADAVDMVEVIKASAEAVMPLIQEKGIELEVKAPKKVSNFTGDRDRLVQVVVNLLSNAIKFVNEEKGWIGVFLEEKDQQLILSVKDNGKGIPKEFQPYVFDKFTQFSDHKSGVKQGSGLGLSISWRIIRIHKGSISVEGEEGEGATFVVKLPLVPGAVEPMLVPSYRRKTGPAQSA